MNTVLLSAGACVAAWLLTTVLHALALIPFWRTPRGEHWTMRARQLHTARTSAGIHTLLVMVGIVVCILDYFGRNRGSGWVIFATAAGTVLGSRILFKAAFPERSWLQWFRETIPQTVLGILPWAPLFVGIVVIPGRLDFHAWMVIASVVVAYLAYVLGGWLWLQKRLGLIVPAPEDLCADTARVATSMGMQPPTVGVFSSPLANAFAIVTNHTILFSSRTLEILTPTQVRLIAAHECAHLGESRSVVLARVFFALWPLAFLFIHPVVRLAGAPIAVMIFFGVWLARQQAMTALGAKMEKRADSEAVAFSPEENCEYAHALRALYENNLIPAVVSGDGLPHGHLYDRMVAAGVTPDFARPEPPRRIAVSTIVIGILAYVIFAVSRG